MLVIRIDSAHATPSKLQDGGKGEQVVRQVVGDVESSLGSTKGFPLQDSLGGIKVWHGLQHLSFSKSIYLLYVHALFLQKIYKKMGI